MPDRGFDPLAAAQPLPREEPPPAGEPPPSGDPLAALRSHVRSAQMAAERLAREAGAQAADTDTPRTGPAGGGQDRARAAAAGPPSGEAGGRTPPRGWEPLPSSAESASELTALIELLDSLRALLPEELREQLNDLVRQILLLTRAVIDHLVLRLEREAVPPARVSPIEDIPIS